MFIQDPGSGPPAFEERDGDGDADDGLADDDGAPPIRAEDAASSFFRATFKPKPKAKLKPAKKRR